MIIWGSKGRKTQVGVGDFYCPRCDRVCSYRRMQVGRFFTLYFIPIFETKRLGEYIECGCCLTEFGLAVLELGHKIKQRDADQQKFIDFLTEQLQAGLPFQDIARGLVGAGASESQASGLLHQLTAGQGRKCSTCGRAYWHTIGYCSQCGGALPPAGRL